VYISLLSLYQLICGYSVDYKTRSPPINLYAPQKHLLVTSFQTDYLSLSLSKEKEKEKKEK